MSEISRFLGIIVFMYFNEHNPPHLHVCYDGYRAAMDIRTLNVLKGQLPARVRVLVEEWMEEHQSELLDMWESKQFHRVEPLV